MVTVCLKVAPYVEPSRRLAAVYEKIFAVGISNLKFPFLRGELKATATGSEVVQLD